MNLHHVHLWYSGLHWVMQGCGEDKFFPMNSENHHVPVNKKVNIDDPKIS